MRAGRARTRVAAAVACLPLALACEDSAPPPSSVSRAAGSSASPASVPAVPSAADQKIAPGLQPAYRAIGARNGALARAEVERYIAEAGSAARRGQAEFLIGLSYHDPELYELAEPHFARARELEPGYLATYYYHGFALWKLGRVPEARAAFERYLALEPDKPDALFGLALVALEEDRVEEAEALLRRAIAGTEPRLRAGTDDDARSDLSRYLARLSDVHLRRDELEAARAALERSVELWPDHYEAWHKLHRVATRQGDAAAASRALENYERVFARRFPERATLPR
jgi:tetratricopeptide (TPR) repeat protein